MAALQIKRLNSSFNKNASNALEIVDILRSSFLNQPWTMLRNGVLALANYNVKSCDYWHIATHICRAAAECGDQHTAHRFLHRILTMFPDSLRHRILKGIVLESQGKSNQAMDLYINTISTNPMTPTAYKRQVAVLKGQSKSTEAIALLNYYLSIYSHDVEAWTELCALCLKAGRLSHALYAASELVLIDSGNYAHHLLLADVYMTHKPTVHNVKNAQIHYIASASNRKRFNLRALYGIWLTTNLLLTAYCDQQHDAERLDALRLQTHTQRAIMAVYKSESCQEQHVYHVDALFSNSA